MTVSVRQGAGADVRIREAQVPAEIPVVRALFEAYAASLDVDLCFQGFAAELDGLPGRYAPPRGGLWLAFSDDRAIGCVALRALAADRCEMKRLYLNPDARGAGVGRRLVQAALLRAIEAGHRSVCLDTLPSMTDAIALYRSLGFTEIAPYYDNPVPGALFLERQLR